MVVEKAEYEVREKGGCFELDCSNNTSISLKQNAGDRLEGLEGYWVQVISKSGDRKSLNRK